MDMKEELLPCEVTEPMDEGEKRVKLVLATSHSIPKMGQFSLFGNPGGETDELKEELLADLHVAADAAFQTPVTGEELLVSEYEETEEESAAFEDEQAEADRIFFGLLSRFLEESSEQGREEETNQFVLRLDGIMSRCDGDIVIRYAEEDPNGDMGLTETEVVLHGGRRDMVSIIRHGTVESSLICEKGRRHISVYRTPVMPFQVCLMAKECEHNVDFETGGTILLNYFVELRGTDTQHTKMRMTVRV